ncbi:ComF family protein [Synechococcus sp. PCC 6312]|uniref:ComF family protein n=1 Tax=Synechococcus sp. (strain ATCC 27167 / PCC 6312) TaxID=195253 RepID=UPI00029EE310|nr:ComF family protein [Synechococcus sp. PCC 6312]AFY62588.1 putative amidophosphoribosyltransferase [Synechococcus sp. PCC 6312]
MTWFNQIKSWLTNLGAGLLGLITRYPCAFCGKSKKNQRQIHGLCQSCYQKIQAAQLPTPQTIWNKTQNTLPILAWGDYNPILRQAIFRLKYDKSLRMAQPLGIWLGQAWVDLKLKQLPPLIVVPIPLHPDRLQERGFNQAELVAQSFCRYTNLPLAPHGLIRRQATEAMHQLNDQQRAEMMKNAFALGSGIQRNQFVLLLDDIYTSGSTIQAAKATLNRAGIRVYGVAVLSLARPRHYL